MILILIFVAQHKKISQHAPGDAYFVRFEKHKGHTVAYLNCY